MCDKFFNILNNGINYVSKQFNTIINNIEKFVKEHKNNTNNTNNNSFINCKEIRHPIIEHIQTKTPYVTNDIVLGDNDINGILLFGTNASGKSSLMKAIGLNIIMAQAGCYVASTEFRYNPYKYLFTITDPFM